MLGTKCEERFMSKGMSKIKKQNIYNKLRGHCAYCGEIISPESMHVDHILPKKLGGKNHTDNLYPSCQRCNTVKGDKVLEEFRLHLMLSKSEFRGVINFKQWQMLNELGVVINLPIHFFYFEWQRVNEPCKKTTVLYSNKG